MNIGDTKPNDMIYTTDYLEAVGVFKGWRNFIFVVLLICLVLMQGGFWLVDTGYVKLPAEKQQEEAQTQQAGITEPPAQPALKNENRPKSQQGQALTPAIPEEIEQAARQIAPGEQAAQQVPDKETKPEKIKRIIPAVKQAQWLRLMRVVNFVVIVTSILYCLTMFFTLKISMLGRLGGINHISRAFFLSLVTLVLLLPWQIFFQGLVSGVMYRPAELLSDYTRLTKLDSAFESMLYYIRYCVYWLVVTGFLILTQIRSVRWSRASLRRLEVA